jgi:hypothetical protein
MVDLTVLMDLELHHLSVAHLQVLLKPQLAPRMPQLALPMLQLAPQMHRQVQVIIIQPAQMNQLVQVVHCNQMKYQDTRPPPDVAQHPRQAAITADTPMEAKLDQSTETGVAVEVFHHWWQTEA